MIVLGRSTGNRATLTQSRTLSGKEDAKAFKETFCYPDVKVHFVGVWDTVSSIGFRRSKLDYPDVASGMEHVCYFRHALALDERRVKFLPEYARGGAGPTEEDITSCRGKPRVKEVWFAGTHSDIGGGNTDNRELSNNGPALRWMVNEARKFGVRIGPCNKHWANNAEKDVKVNKSLTLGWWPLELLPITRLSYSSEKGGKDTTRRPHFGKRRQVSEHQWIHKSVYNQTSEAYRTKRGLQSRCVTSTRSEQDDEDLATIEIAKAVIDLSENHPAGDDRYNGRIKALDRYKDERFKQVTEDLYEGLFRDKDNHSSRTRVEMDVLTNLHRPVDDSSRKVECSKLPSILVKMITDADDHHSYWRDTAKSFLDKYSSGLFAESGLLSGGPITSITFSDNSDRVAACSPDIPTLPIIRFLECDNTPPLYLKEHNLSVASCVAFSADGRLAVASSKGICFWESGRFGVPICQTEQEKCTFFEFSRDGCRLLFAFSTSTKSTLKIFERQSTASRAPWKSFDSYAIAGMISQATFSPADDHILICAEKERIEEGLTKKQSALHLIDTTKGRQLQVRDEDEKVTSLTFSDDGKKIYVGNACGAIEVKEANTLEGISPKRKLAAQDAPSINSLALSPDGTRLLCGTTKGAIMLDTKEDSLPQIGSSLVQAADVRSVAWSPDGRCYAIGTAKGYLFLYDGTNNHYCTLESLKNSLSNSGR
ncbi:hypothetical protein V5O48_012553 [Marasmius crinis-equi]|uniref:T6SS Phospholipase effector Tle1-like catalytic domain-containing protein n=1 Tax=Marasmius crinis-equi TaxID=585013 RepID=A0ABR3F2J0_9AGAR